MKAIWNDTVVAEADRKDLIYIEGNWYFPKEALKKEFFTATDKHTVCYWKGLASYYQVNVNGKVNEDGAWYYPKPTSVSKKIVKQDFTDYVAFWHGVTVTEQRGYV